MERRFYAVIGRGELAATKIKLYHHREISAGTKAEEMQKRGFAGQRCPPCASPATGGPGCAKLRAIHIRQWLVNSGLPLTRHRPLPPNLGRTILTATILDGNKIRDEIQSELLQQIADLKRVGVTPGLAAVLVGENPASQIYVRSKVKTCEALGLYSEKIERSKDSTTEELLQLVNDLNRNDAIDGILVQLPLPPQVDTKRVLMAVDPAKDVDGFHPVNVGNLVAGRTGFVPCTPAGILEILKRSKIPLKGARAVVIGRSDIVGKPVAMLLLHEHATVTICHSRTRDLPASGARSRHPGGGHGEAGFRTADFIKPGATVIDVGINRLTTEEEVRKIFHDPTGPSPPCRSEVRYWWGMCNRKTRWPSPAPSPQCRAAWDP